jgi:hypothetical protein
MIKQSREGDFDGGGSVARGGESVGSIGESLGAVRESRSADSEFDSGIIESDSTAAGWAGQFSVSKYINRSEPVIEFGSFHVTSPATTFAFGSGLNQQSLTSYFKLLGLFGFDINK